MINIIKKYKNNIPKENINKFKKIKIEDYTTKKINDIQNEKIKLKRINLNQLLKMGKIKRKYKMEITKGKKRMFNLKITFRDHFSTEGNRISDNDKDTFLFMYIENGEERMSGSSSLERIKGKTLSEIIKNGLGDYEV